MSSAIPNVLAERYASPAIQAIWSAEGRIVLELDQGKAPVTTANFLRYVDQKRFDGTNYYAYTDVSLKVPTPIGSDIKVGFESARGTYISGEPSKLRLSWLALAASRNRSSSS